MTTVNNAWQAVWQRIESAAQTAGRPVTDISLLAVSKTVEAARIRQLAQLGQRAFGENYVQEALDKMAVLTDQTLEWHFIGPVQRNKTAAIATHFDWVHSVDRFLVASRLSAARPRERGLLNVCIQVNLSDEATKSGVTAAELPDLVSAIKALPNLRLRGLMAIPRPEKTVAAQRAQFAAVRCEKERLNRLGAEMDTLSMGMSADLESAIMEGATLVRVGSSLFGERIRTAAKESKELMA